MSTKKKTKTQIYRTENKFDPYMTKDAVVKFITDEVVVKQSYKESHKYFPFKAILGLLLVVNTVYSHYHFIPYPQDYYILLVCTIIYYVATFIYQRYEKNTEGDVFVVFQDSKTNNTLGFGATQELYESKMTLTLYDVANARIVVSKRIIEVSDYIDQNGYVCQQQMSDLVKVMIEEGKKKSN